MRRLTDPGLWARINALALDDPIATRPYSARLAHVEGWRPADTQRVIAEYRRFLYLTQLIDQTPVPAPAIDAAWQLHLTYTRSYWDRFVPEVLHRPLHRDAEAARDTARRRAYHGVITAAYEQEFGKKPPRDIWQHPLQPNFGGLLVAIFVSGFAVAILGGLILYFLGWLTNLGSEKPATGLLANGWAAAFIAGWCLTFFSPLWAWLISRFLPHLRSKKRRRPGPVSWSFGISVSR